MLDEDFAYDDNDLAFFDMLLDNDYHLYYFTDLDAVTISDTSLLFDN